MRGHRIPPSAVCGVVRNGGGELQRTLQKLQELREFANELQYIIVTNDNNDETDLMLAEWSKSDQRCKVLNVDGLVNTIPNRVDRICAARNFYLHHLRCCLPKSLQFLFVFDLDGPNSEIDIGKLVEAVSSQTGAWAGLFPNQPEGYYDIYALRHRVWSPNDCWVEVEKSVRFPFRNRKRVAAVHHHVYSRQFRIPPNWPAFQVDSAFGGLAIYRMESIRNCWYGSRDQSGRVVSEHVLFNSQVKEAGGKLIILPGLLNNAPSEHLGRGSGMEMPSGLISFVS
jgi:hypothetical protein